MRFTQFLSETTIVVPAEVKDAGPQAVAAYVRQKSQKAQRNPQMAARDNIKNARDARQDAAEMENSPTQQLQMRIAKKREELAKLEQQLERMAR